MSSSDIAVAVRGRLEDVDPLILGDALGEEAQVGRVARPPRAAVSNGTSNEAIGRRDLAVRLGPLRRVAVVAAAEGGEVFAGLLGG